MTTDLNPCPECASPGSRPELHAHGDVCAFLTELHELHKGTFEVYIDGKLVGYVRPSGKDWWFPAARYGTLAQAQAERSPQAAATWLSR